MSERTWTKAQKIAIEDEGGSLLIDAAAGSGKTAVLVERAVRLMTREQNPIAADRMLILTFTNAAAEELRIRLAKRLDQALESEGGNPFLRRQKSLLQRAFIGTIDSFCIQLVGEQFAQLGTPPDLSVGQAAVLSELSEQALQQALEQAYEQADFAKFSALYGRSRSDTEAAQAILDLHNFVNTLPWPSRWLEKFVQMYHINTPFCKTVWGKQLLGYAADALRSAHALANAAVQQAEDDGALEAWLPMLRDDVWMVEHLMQLVQKEQWDDCERFLRGAAPARLATVRGYEGEGKAQVQSLRGDLKHILDELRKYCFVCSEEEHAADLATLLPMVQALCTATEKYSQLYFELKMEKKLLDFSDFEHLALQLLMSQEGERLPIAEEISARYDFVMVDEYQDTNELQSALYSCLGNKEGSNLFYVGDVKQSIYRFRRANPGLFLEKKHTWAAHDSGQKPAVLRLGHNFRSGPSVIEGVNYVFEELMSETLGDVHYGEEERLLQGGNGSIRDGFSLTVLEETESGDEARFVAEKIWQMIRDKVPVQEGEHMRPCEFGDFCILLRTRSSMAEFMQALQEAKIPTNSDVEQDLLSTAETLPLQAVLAAIDNPGDDVQLVAALVSPLFRFSLDEIALLRAVQKEGSLYGALLASQEEKCVKFVQSLAHFRTLSTEMDLGRFCEELTLRTGYLSAVAAMENGMARRENVHRFLHWAAEMGHTLSGGLSAFVRLLQKRRGPQGAGYRHRAGHVSLLTAHKSKGLEFPIVIFSDTAHSFNARDLSARIQFHTEFGVGLRLRAQQTLYPTLPLLAVRHRNLQESLSEEMRVLYVALTRARDRLFIVNTQKKPEKKIASLASIALVQADKAYLLSRQNSMGDWLLSALLCHADAAPLWDYIGMRQPANIKKQRQQCKMEMHVCTPSEKEPPILEEAEFLEADMATVASLQANFSAVLPRQVLQEIPRKLSVSALSKADTSFLRKRPSLLYSTGLTAAERGTAMHTFLQLVPYTEDIHDVEREIERLVAGSYLSPAQAKSLSRKGLSAFFASSLFKRIQKAKRVLREYDFITAIPATRIEKELPKELSGERVYLQGIADVVLVQDDGIEIVDYKTDRGKTEQELCAYYEGQLHLYAQAIEKRLNLPVKRLTLWSFALEKEVAVPLGG